MTARWATPGSKSEWRPRERPPRLAAAAAPQSATPLGYSALQRRTCTGGGSRTGPPPAAGHELRVAGPPRAPLPPPLGGRVRRKEGRDGRARRRRAQLPRPLQWPPPRHAAAAGLAPAAPARPPTAPSNDDASRAAPLPRTSTWTAEPTCGRSHSPPPRPDRTRGCRSGSHPPHASPSEAAGRLPPPPQRRPQQRRRHALPAGRPAAWTPASRPRAVGQAATTAPWQRPP